MRVIAVACLKTNRCIPLSFLFPFKPGSLEVKQWVLLSFKDALGRVIKYLARLEHLYSMIKEQLISGQWWF